MAEHGSQPGDGLGSNGGPNPASNGREDTPRGSSPSPSNAPGSSHLVPSAGPSANGAAPGAEPRAASASNGAEPNGNGSRENGAVLSVDDPRTRALLEQLLNTITTDGGAGAREKPRPPLISEWWLALRRRWKPMLVVFALSLLGISWKLRPVGSQFVSYATMLLPRSATSTSPDTLSAIGGQRDAPGSTLDTQIAIIESGPFVQRVKLTTKSLLQKQARRGRLAAPFPLVSRAVDGATFKAAAPVSPELVNITVTSDNPIASMALANTSIDIYGQRLIERGDEAQKGDVHFVREQRNIASRQLDKAKEDLQHFKEKYHVFDIQEALTRNNGSVEDLAQKSRAANIEAEAGAQAASVSGDASTQSLQQRASESKLKYDAVLRDFYPTSPEGLEAKAQYDAAQDLYLRRVSRLVQQNQQTARDVAANLVGAQRRAATLPAIEYQMSKLQDRVAQAAMTYSQLSTRYTSLALSSAAKAATADPIERALGALEVSRTWSRALMTGLLCALIMAALCALLLEQLDHSLHSVSDLEPLLPVGVLGTMPLLRGRAERRLAQMTGAQPMAPRVLEACRIVRSNLSFATMDSPAQTILITSAAPGEGKSLSALNLATVTAFDGRRVLLLDCDLRRPSQHTLNGLALEPGFTNLLAGEASIDEALQSTRVNNLWVMTAGTLPLNPPELLGSPEARRLLQEFKGRFDVIVIDSPPVLALTDAQVLCSQVDGVVMIVAAESTSKEEVQRAQGMLRHAGGRLLGAVFNKVRRSDATPGYGTYASYGPNMLGRDSSLSDSVGTLARR